jgi:hypothetical protein
MSIYNLCLSQSSLRFLYQECFKKQMKDEEIIELFGLPPYAFSGESSYKNEKISSQQNINVAPYREFGVYDKGIASRRNIYYKLPEWMQKLIPVEQVGPWRDNIGREYKFEEVISSHNHERWSSRLPIKLTKKDEQLYFPKVGEKLKLARTSDQHIDVEILDIALQRNNKSKSCLIILKNLHK